MKNYHPFETAFDGAVPPDETRSSEASYNPTGFIEPGAEYTLKQREDLAESYRLMRETLKLLKLEDFRVWMSVVPVPRGPADLRVVAERARSPTRGCSPRGSSSTGTCEP